MDYVTTIIIRILIGAAIGATISSICNMMIDKKNCITTTKKFNLDHFFVDFMSAVIGGCVAIIIMLIVLIIRLHSYEN